MRILHVLPSYDPSFGGPVSVAISVNVVLSSQGSVSIIGPGMPSESWRPLGGRGFRRLQSPVGPKHTLTISIGMLWWILKNGRHFDFAYVHLSKGLVTLPGASILRLLGVPLIIQTHGMCMPWTSIGGQLFDKFALWPLLRSAKCVFVLTANERATLEAFAPGCNAALLPNSVVLPEDGHSREVSPTKVRVLFASRLHPRKGLPTFIRVCRGLSDRGFEVLARVAGADEGALTEGLRLARELRVEAHFLGSLDRRAVDREMRNADLLLHPAPHEPFGMSMLEAFALGLPVVAAASSEISPILRKYGAAGLVPDADMSAWVDVAEILLRNEGARKRQVASARTMIDAEFSPKSVEHRILEVLDGRT